MKSCRERISLVTPSYNQAEFIGRTIDSVLEQAGDFDLDYLVIDGGSTDETLDILAGYGTRVRWVSERDEGQIDAINKGLRRATGNVVGWLNSDDVLLPGALQRVSECFENQQCQWLHGGCKIIDRHDNEIRKWISSYKHRRGKNFRRARLLRENFVSQMTVFWRRELMDQVGYLDPTLPLAFDYDYWLRFSKVCDPHFIDAPIAAFRWYAASKSGAGYVAQCREDEMIARRHGLKGWAGHRKQLQNRMRIGIYRLYDSIRRNAVQ